MKGELKILPLGGLGEIGMNLMMIQYDTKAIIVDCGVMFADNHLPGIDMVVPDFSPLLAPDIDFCGVILTHGHEDHIGALPFLLRQKNVPVYGSQFTLALVKERLREHSLLGQAKLNLVKEGERRGVGPFDVEFMTVSHSIADALAVAIQTPVGKILHTGDFKIDPNPADGRKTDLSRMKELGDEGLFLLLSDSTNVEIPGPSISESSVKSGLELLIRDAPAWVVVSSFASHIPRLSQVIDLAKKYKRKIYVAGRSMITNIGISRELGYLNVPDQMLVDLDEATDLPRKELVVLSTGCQGEPTSALARMALDQHKELKIMPGDRVILSSRFIPGNERSIFTIVNHLYRRGAEVYTTKGGDVHVSGHGYRDDLEQVLKATRPKYFIPVHGEYRHLVIHNRLAQETGIPKERTLLLEDGHGVVFNNNELLRLPPLKLNRSVVDGRELGDIASSVLRDRRQLSDAGLVVAILILDAHSGEVVRGPELFSRGLAFEGRVDEFLAQAREVILDRLDELGAEARTGDFEVQEEVRLAVRRFFKNKLDRKPVVIPIVLEV